LHESAESRFAIEVEYPQFDSPGREVLNRRILGVVQTHERSYVAAAESRERIVMAPFSLVGSYAVTLDCPAVVSMRLAFSGYTGGAHGQSWLEVLSFASETQNFVQLEDVFEEPEAGLAKLSELSVRGLINQGRDSAHSQRGAAPEPGNFEHFNLGPEGLQIYFGEYQVGCYAEGPAEVTIPYTAVRPYLSEFLLEVIRKHGGTGA
jgi:hypothetical protein